MKTLRLDGIIEDYRGPRVHIDFDSADIVPRCTRHGIWLVKRWNCSTNWRALYRGMPVGSPKNHMSSLSSPWNP